MSKTRKTKIKAKIRSMTKAKAQTNGTVVISAGGVPGQVAGLLQVTARVPDGVTPGDAVPVVSAKMGDCRYQRCPHSARSSFLSRHYG